MIAAELRKKSECEYNHRYPNVSIIIKYRITNVSIIGFGPLNVEYLVPRTIFTLEFDGKAKPEALP